MTTLIGAVVFGAATLAPAGPAQLTYEGSYVEGCSCAPPCPCELTGVRMGCEGVGGFHFLKGTFGGKDISGVRMAYAVAPGDWITCYVDAPDATRRAAAVTLCRTAFKDWGKMGPVKSAKITIEVTRGRCKLRVDGGSVMSLDTEPIFGIDKTTAMRYTNINSPLHPEVWQAKTVKCTYRDDDRSFEIEDTNGYYNPTIKVNHPIG